MDDLGVPLFQETSICFNQGKGQLSKQLELDRRELRFDHLKLGLNCPELRFIDHQEIGFHMISPPNVILYQFMSFIVRTM